jgi:hypothetical protein
MKRMLIFLAILTSQLFAINANSEVITTNLSIAHENASKIFSLKGVILKDAKWTDLIIRNELKKVNTIFAQCDVQIKDITVTRIHYSSTINAITDVLEISKNLEQIKFKKRKEIVMIFAGSLGGELKLKSGKNTGGFSFNHINLSESPMSEMCLENISVMLDNTHTDEYKILRNNDYSPLAHELGHVILDEGHVDFPNLMAVELGAVNGELTKEQCEIIKNSDLLK